MGLRDLPVVPDIYSDSVRDTYIWERAFIGNTNELKAFTKRWRPLYKLKPVVVDPESPPEVQKTMRNMQALADGTWWRGDFWVVWDHLNTLRGGADCGCGPTGSCVAMHIMLPVPLLRAHMVGSHFGVTTNLALIQDNGGVGELENY